MRRAAIISSVSAAIVWGSAALGQGQQPQAGQQVDNRVNRELYGNDRPTNVPLYGPQFEPLPSEALFAAQRSGALPSEIRMQAAAVGPLAPYGAASYIPAESALQRASRARPPTLWGPAYVELEPTATGTPAPIPAPSVQQNVAPGERRLDLPPSPQYVSPQMVQPQAAPAGYRVNGSANEANGPVEGTTYRVLPRTRPPATQPAATQPTPSLGDRQR